MTPISLRSLRAWFSRAATIPDVTETFPGVPVFGGFTISVYHLLMSKSIEAAFVTGMASGELFETVRVSAAIPPWRFVRP